MSVQTFDGGSVKVLCNVDCDGVRAFVYGLGVRGAVFNSPGNCTVELAEPVPVGPDAISQMLVMVSSEATSGVFVEKGFLDSTHMVVAFQSAPGVPFNPGGRVGIMIIVRDLPLAE